MPRRKLYFKCRWGYFCYSKVGCVETSKFRPIPTLLDEALQYLAGMVESTISRLRDPPPWFLLAAGLISRNLAEVFLTKRSKPIIRTSDTY